MRVLSIFGCLVLINILGCANTDGTKKTANAKAKSETRLSLGLSYLQLGQLPQAKQNLDIAHALAPENVNVYYGLGYYQWQLGAFDEADAHFQRALSIQPTAGYLNNAYGAFQCEYHNLTAAKPFFKLALTDQDYPNQALVYSNWGRCALLADDVNLAIQQFYRSLQLQPTNIFVYHQLSEIYLSYPEKLEVSEILNRFFYSNREYRSRLQIPSKASLDIEQSATSDSSNPEH